MAADYSQYYYTFPQVTYKVGEKDRDPLIPSYLESRAVGSGTGGIYVAFDTATAFAEKRDKLNHPVLYRIECTKEIQILDLEKYCRRHSIPPTSCYSGEHSLEKEIHKFNGHGVSAMSWPSSPRPEGTSAVILVGNITNYRGCFRAVEVNNSGKSI